MYSFIIEEEIPHVRIGDGLHESTELTKCLLKMRGENSNEDVNFAL